VRLFGLWAEDDVGHCEGDPDRRARTGPHRAARC
jgi:hypothetical protein